MNPTHVFPDPISATDNADGSITLVFNVCSASTGATLATLTVTTGPNPLYADITTAALNATGEWLRTASGLSRAQTINALIQLGAQWTRFQI